MLAMFLGPCASFLPEHAIKPSPSRAGRLGDTDGQQTFLFILGFLAPIQDPAPVSVQVDR